GEARYDRDRAERPLAGVGREVDRAATEAAAGGAAGDGRGGDGERAGRRLDAGQGRRRPALERVGGRGRRPGRGRAEHGGNAGDGERTPEPAQRKETG